MTRKTTKNNPRFAQIARPLKIVVEGVGDVIKNYYLPALEALRNKLQGRREIQVTFADKSEFWRSDPRLASKMQSIIDFLRSWGANYLDKSDPTDLAKYQVLEADVVIIATPDFTHVEVAEEWLRRQPRPEQIFIEKPLADSLNAARRLFGISGPSDDGILAFDHYRARLLPSRDQMSALLGFWGKGLRHFTFYFLEDHSGADPHYPAAATTGRDGAIENEQRVRTLNQGVILDVMPHVIAILAHFAQVESLLVTRVRVGQYAGVDGDPDKRTEIDKETFAEIGFVCRDYARNQVEGTVYLGKGVRGLESLGAEYDYNVKVLDIEGLNGNKTRFDLRSSGDGSSRAYLIDRNDDTQFEFALNPKPYETFLEKVADGTYLDDQLALNVEVGMRILKAMEDMSYPIPDNVNIPTYPSGMSGGRQSLYLEEILGRLPILYGR